MQRILRLLLPGDDICGKRYERGRSGEVSEKIQLSYSKRHNKLLFPVSVKAIFGSFCRNESTISNVVNYSKMIRREEQETNGL